MNIAVFVGTRADLGPLEPVLAELGTDPQVRLEVLTGVAFDSAELAAYLSAALGITAEVVQLAPQMPTADAAGVTAQGELLVAGAHRYFAERAASAERSADALVVLGDRWELLFIVPQAYLHRVPIVHLHGGEVTEGALDERVRHAVTKLADVHCVASARAAIRVRQLGEPAASIHLTGAPGLDRIADAIPLQDDELRDRFGHALPRPLALFTYHPPTTTETGDPGRQAADALRGVLAHAGSVIVTAPGYDAGRDEIIAAIRELADGDPRIVYVESIGALFPRVLRAVDVVVGNSSSGIIEAPTALVPSVDIGQRQQGRERAGSVFHAEEGAESVAAAVRAALELPRRAGPAFDNPYGDGSAAQRIAAAIGSARDTLRMKPFSDLPDDALPRITENER